MEEIGRPGPATISAGGTPAGFDTVSPGRAATAMEQRAKSRSGSLQVAISG